MLWQNLLQAFRAINGNRLRAILTMLIIAFGITAIVGVLTSIDGIKHWMRESFSTLGANTFVIRNRAPDFQTEGPRRKQSFPPIKLAEAREFRRRAPEIGLSAVNIAISVKNDAQARFRSRSTHTNLALRGSDEHLLEVKAYELAEGRSLSRHDVESRAKVVIIGYDIKEELFPYSSPIGRNIFIGRQRYRVVGLLARQGAAIGSGADERVIIPLTTAYSVYDLGGQSLELNVYVQQAEQLASAEERAIGLFRLIRGLEPGQATNFASVVSGSFVDNLMANLRILTWSATAIAIITLIGAAIGLMNIMLVSVTERTREIGVRKAMGATAGQVQLQFLTEAITICQLGGLLGIVFGVGAGNLIGAWLATPFLIPWGWMLLAIALCLLVGVVSGWYPAQKAAKLDPIVALRYE
jgi:putative ABC transport system permease protein